MSSGKIELCIGPMGGGKTSELIRLINREKIAKKRTLLIKHGADDRSGNKNEISLHNGLKVKADIVTDDLSKVNVKDYDVVGIDEGHFFEDLKIVERWANEGIYVIIATLVSNSDRESFIHVKGVSPVLELIPKCEKITTFCAVCVRCGKEAHFTRKKGKPNKNTIDVGGFEKYEPVCRKCYFIYNSGVFARIKKH